MGAVEFPRLLCWTRIKVTKINILDAERVDAHRFRRRYSGILLVGSVQHIDPPLQFPDASSQSMNFCACKEKRLTPRRSSKYLVHLMNKIGTPFYQIFVDFSWQEQTEWNTGRTVGLLRIMKIQAWPGTQHRKRHTSKECEHILVHIVPVSWPRDYP